MMDHNSWTRLLLMVIFIGNLIPEIESTREGKEIAAEPNNEVTKGKKPAPDKWPTEELERKLVENYQRMGQTQWEIYEAEKQLQMKLMEFGRQQNNHSMLSTMVRNRESGKMENRAKNLKKTSATNAKVSPNKLEDQYPHQLHPQAAIDLNVQPVTDDHPYSLPPLHRQQMIQLHQDLIKKLENLRDQESKAVASELFHDQHPIGAGGSSIGKHAPAAFGKPGTSNTQSSPVNIENTTKNEFKKHKRKSIEKTQKKWTNADAKRLKSLAVPGKQKETRDGKKSDQVHPLDQQPEIKNTPLAKFTEQNHTFVVHVTDPDGRFTKANVFFVRIISPLPTRQTPGNRLARWDESYGCWKVEIPIYGQLIELLKEGTMVTLVVGLLGKPKIRMEKKFKFSRSKMEIIFPFEEDAEISFIHAEQFSKPAAEDMDDDQEVKEEEQIEDQYKPLSTCSHSEHENLRQAYPTYPLSLAPDYYRQPWEPLSNSLRASELRDHGQNHTDLVGIQEEGNKEFSIEAEDDKDEFLHDIFNFDAGEHGTIGGQQEKDGKD